MATFLVLVGVGAFLLWVVIAIGVAFVSATEYEDISYPGSYKQKPPTIKKARGSPRARV